MALETLETPTVRQALNGEVASGSGLFAFCRITRANDKEMELASKFVRMSFGLQKYDLT